MATLKSTNINGSLSVNGDIVINGNVLDTSVYEANLNWGGKNLSANYSPVDAGIVPCLGANRFAGIPAKAISVEYSRDGGSTWTDYGASDASKASLFTTQANFIIGKNDSTGVDVTNYQTRITLTQLLSNLYTVLNKFVIYISTNGSAGCYVSIDIRTTSNSSANNDSWTNIVNKAGISGWSGYNVINSSGIIFGSGNEHCQNIRFTFGCTETGNTNYTGLSIYKLYGYGGVGWSTPSELANNGVPYNYDYALNVNFPANLTVKNQHVALKDDVDKKLDKTGGTISGNLNVLGNLTVGGSTDVQDTIATKSYVESKIAIKSASLSGTTLTLTL